MELPFDGRSVRVTVSMGVALSRPGEAWTDSWSAPTSRCMRPSRRAQPRGAGTARRGVKPPGGLGLFTQPNALPKKARARRQTKRGSDGHNPKGTKTGHSS